MVRDVGGFNRVNFDLLAVTLEEEVEMLEGVTALLGGRRQETIAYVAVEDVGFLIVVRHGFFGTVVVVGVGVTTRR